MNPNAPSPVTSTTVLPGRRRLQREPVRAARSRGAPCPGRGSACAARASGVRSLLQNVVWPAVVDDERVLGQPGRRPSRAGDRRVHPLGPGSSAPSKQSRAVLRAVRRRRATPATTASARDRARRRPPRPARPSVARASPASTSVPPGSTPAAADGSTSRWMTRLRRPAPDSAGRAPVPQPRRQATPGQQHDVRLPQGAHHALAADQPAVAEEAPDRRSGPTPTPICVAVAAAPSRALRRARSSAAPLRRGRRRRPPRAAAAPPSRSSARRLRRAAPPARDDGAGGAATGASSAPESPVAAAAARHVGGEARGARAPA